MVRIPVICWISSEVERRSRTAQVEISKFSSSSRRRPCRAARRVFESWFDSTTGGFDSLWCWSNRIRRLYICRMMYAGAYHRLESGWQGNLLGSTPTFGAIPVWVSLPYSQRVEEPPRVPRKTSIVNACVAHDPSSEPFFFLPVVELADTADLSPAAARHPGSNPGRETIGETQKVKPRFYL